MSMRLFDAGLLVGIALLPQFAPAAAPPDDGLVARPCYNAPDEKPNVESLMKQFQALFKEGKYAEAEVLACRARELAPDSASANLALVLVRQHKSHEASRPEKEIERRLSSPVTVNFENAPLKQVIDDLRDFHGINIVPDLPALQEAGVSLDTPISIKVENVPLKTALTQLLRQAKLTFLIKDEVLSVTTEDRARGKLRTITYAVGDLVIPAKPALVGGPGATRTCTTEDKLIKLICATVQPRSWSDRGGRATIDYFPLTMSLVVSQTAAVQEQVADLLEQLRRTRDTEVTVELRFLTVGDDCLEKLGLDDEAAGKSSPAPGVAILDDSQVKVLMETLQSDPSSIIMQAPKLTCANRQEAVIEMKDREAFVTGIDRVPLGDRNGFRPRVQTMSTGLRVAVQPVVAADNRNVALQLAIDLARLDALPMGRGGKVIQVIPPRHSAIHLEKTLRVPDGATALLSGWSVVREAHNQIVPPVIGQLPLVGQLFRTLKTTRQKEHLLVMVTTRIVVPREEEEKKESVSPAPEGEKLEPVPQRRGAVEASEETDEPVPANKPAVKYVSSRSFTLAYDVDNEGPSKVASIVVWYTRDGHAWTRYPEPIRPTRAIPITVVSDGRYGFTLVARSGAGLSVPEPMAGDQPQVWVEVDTTQPVAELYAPQADLDHPGNLLLSWKADDRNLAAHPIELSWSASAQGPWQVIGTELPNTGRHSWRVPENLPSRAYLRLSVRDRAGNSSVAQTHEDVVIDLKVPQVRGVEVKVKVKE